MSIDRRASGQLRRRRVLYQTSREGGTETAAQRRTVEKMREARKPTASYGSHVNRRLRGRWFSMVPVSSAALSAWSISIGTLAGILIFAHWLSVTWQPIAGNVELARPLRLDHNDGFGGWTRSFFFACSSATALLIYQLRRYKVDDYTGQYRIWRPVILLSLVLSIDAVANVTPWGGAVLDAILGQRAAMSGTDWVRIALIIGGCAFGARMTAELWRCKLALAWMLISLVAMAIPALNRWTAMSTGSISGWMLATSSSLVAATTLWLCLGTYLRMLYREVRGLNDQALDDGRVQAGLASDGEMTSRGWFPWFSRREPDLPAAPVKAADKPVVKPAAKTVSVAAAAPVNPTAEKSEAPMTEAKRSWFRRNPAVKSEKVVEPPFSQPAPKSTPLKMEPKPAAIKADASKSDVANDQPTAAKSRGLGSWFRRSAADDVAGDAKKTGPVVTAKPTVKPSSSLPASSPPSTSENATSEDDDESGDDSVDWGNLNKSERRRMRKEIKRGGRAA